jgi:glycine cleavage system H protein
MSTGYLETTVDKFIFKVKPGCWYSEAGMWVELEDGRARVGLTDYVQQSSGDMAFVEVKPAGTVLRQGDDLADVETIKVTVAFPSPVSGTIGEVNEELDASPELVNQDPYGVGWLALIEASDWEADKAKLLEAEQYLLVMREQAEEEMQKR